MLDLHAHFCLWQDPSADWPDKSARPYDCPIEDFELPAQQVPRLKAFGFTRIVCSPFRRCLQTAGIVARALNINEVMIHLGVGEVMSKVKTAILETDESAGKMPLAATLGRSSHRQLVHCRRESGTGAGVLDGR